MASTAEGLTTTGSGSGKDRIVEFSPDRLQAPFVLRCAALIIDYMVLLAVPLGGMMIGKALGEGPAAPLNPTVWLIVIVLWIINFLLLPLFRGQTLGKMLTGLRILNLDGTNLRLGRLLLRNTIGYLLTAVTLGLGFLFSSISSTGRALHDYVSGTIVVSGRKKLV